MKSSSMKSVAKQMRNLNRIIITLLCFNFTVGSCFAIDENIDGAIKGSENARKISCLLATFPSINSNNELFDDLRQIAFDGNGNYWVIGNAGLYFFDSSDSLKYTFTFHEFGKGVAVVDEDTLAISATTISATNGTGGSWVETYSISRMLAAAQATTNVVNIDSGNYYLKQNFSDAHSGSGVVADIYYANNSIYAHYPIGGGRTIYQWRYNPETARFDSIHYLNGSDGLADSGLTQHGNTIEGFNAYHNRQLIACSDTGCKTESINFETIKPPYQNYLPLYIKDELYVVSTSTGEIFATTTVNNTDLRYELVDEFNTPMKNIQQAIYASKNNAIYLLNTKTLNYDGEHVGIYNALYKCQL